MIKNNKVEFKNITKKFGDFLANDSISFQVKENDIHAILGENGAGKSTLMSILFGLNKPTFGDVLINDKIEEIKNPKHANQLKIAMLPQHFKLVENMSALENILIGYEKMIRPSNLKTLKIIDKLKADNSNKDVIKKIQENEKTKLNVIRELEINELKKATIEFKGKKLEKEKKKIKHKYFKKLFSFTGSIILNKKEAKYKIEQAMKLYNIKLNLNAKASSLSISDKQKIEILKILWRDADIIIFDEPTSILTPQEIESFLELLKFLQQQGKTIILITHKLSEIKKVANRVSILRKGKYIKTVLVKNVSEKKLAELMVGKVVDLNLSAIRKTKFSDKIKNVLEIKNLIYKGTDYEQSLDKLNLEIRNGEILGIAAIDGNGQSELIKAISGLVKSKGSITIDGVEINNNIIKNRYFDQKNKFSIKEEIKSKIKNQQNLLMKYRKELIRAKATNKSLVKKIKNNLKEIRMEIRSLKAAPLELNATFLSHIPEDRHLYGLILDYTVAQNVVLQDIDSFSSKLGIINKKSIRVISDTYIKKYDIRGVQNDKIKIRALSGGNQQKVILAREIERHPKLLLASHPTRGLDVGAVRNVYTNIINVRNNGAAVLLSSGELDEIMQISDRIIVLHEGKIVSNSKKGKLSKAQLGKLMAGGK